MDLPLPSQSYQTRSKPLSSQRLINLYCEVYNDSGVMKTKSLIGTPGLSVFKDFSLVGSRVQGIRFFRTSLIVVIANKIYTISESGTSNLIYDANSYETEYEDVDFVDNGQNMMITFSSGNGYIVNFFADTFSVLKITDQNFLDNLAGSCSYCSGYFLYSYLETGTIGWSSLLDPTQWGSGLNYFSCEDSPDKITKIICNNRDLLAFHPKGISFYYPTGDSSVWGKNTSVYVDKGSESKFSICIDNNIFYFLGNDRCVYLLKGYTPQKISTPALENELGGYANIENARGSIYTQEGHRFYILKFPTDDKTWVYDITTGLWHERFSYAYNGNELQQSEWKGNYACTAWGKSFASDFYSAIIYELDLDYGKDGDDTIVRYFVFPTLNNEQKRAFYRRLKLDIDAGIGPTETTVMLTYSDDGGYSWSSESWREAQNTGNFGDYKKRVEWRSLGSSKERTFAIKISSQEKINILAAYLDVEGSVY